MPRLTPATFHILLSLAEAPRHGFGIKRAVEARTDDAVRLGPGTLYATLARLVADGLIRQRPAQAGGPATPGPPSPTYHLSATGRRALDRELQQLETDVRTARSVLRTRKGARS